MQPDLKDRKNGFENSNHLDKVIFVSSVQEKARNIISPSGQSKRYRIQ